MNSREVENSYVENVINIPITRIRIHTLRLASFLFSTVILSRFSIVFFTRVLSNISQCFYFEIMLKNVEIKSEIKCYIKSKIIINFFFPLLHREKRLRNASTESQIQKTARW